LSDRVAPVVGVLGRPSVRQRLQGVGVGDPHGDALDDDVLAGAPALRTGAASGPRDVGVGLEVAMLLLVRPGAEGEGAVVPDADERHRVRSTVRANGHDPVELGRSSGRCVLWSYPGRLPHGAGLIGG
jgi:hypothetical protein